MKEIIREAYDLIMPEADVEERIWNRIEAQTEFMTQKKLKNLLKKLLQMDSQKC